MEKAYTRTNWVDDNAPLIDAEHLNNIESGIDTIDDRVVAMEPKLTQAYNNAGVAMNGMNVIQNLYAKKTEVSESLAELEAEVSVNYATKAEVSRTVERLESEFSDTYATRTEVSNVETHLSNFQNLADKTYATKAEVKEISGTVTEIATEVSKGKADVILANASGETIHLKDSTDSKAVEFALLGKATQKQYSGKNLTDMTGIANSYKLPKTLPSGTYTVSFKSTGTIGGFRMSNAIDTSTNSVAKNNTPNSDGYIVITFTTEYETNYVNISSDGDVSEIMLSEGSSYVPYEPYTGGIASPNPDYPQDITVSGADGSVEVKSLGKNLLKNKLPSFNTQGIKFTVNEDGGVTATGTQTGHAYYGFGYIGTSGLLPYIDVTKKYILSGNTTTNSDEWGYCLFLQINLENGNTRYAFNNNPVDTVVNFNEYNSISPITSIIPYIRIGADAPKPVNVTFYPMLSIEGGKYEPYKESTTNISTPNGLAGINGVCDEIVKYADSTGKNIQRIGKLNKNNYATMYIGTYGSNSQYYGYLLSIPTDRKPMDMGAVIGTHLSSITRNEHYSGSVIGFAPAYSSYIGICVDIPTTEEVKQWLINNDVEFYYQLANPIITDLSAEEIAELEVKTFYPTTNILNDSNCGMEITFKADTKNYIDKIIDERISAIETALINNI